MAPVIYRLRWAAALVAASMALMVALSPLGAIAIVGRVTKLLDPMPSNGQKFGNGVSTSGPYIVVGEEGFVETTTNVGATVLFVIDEDTGGITFADRFVVDDAVEEDRAGKSVDIDDG